MLILPTRTDLARYSFEVELDGSSFVLGFEWNDRIGAWFLDVSNSDRVLLLAGRRIVVGYPLIARFKDARLPAGDLQAIDTSGTDTDPGFADLGDRVLLAYTPIADLPDALKVQA